MLDALTQLDGRLNTLDIVLFDHQGNEQRLAKVVPEGYMPRYLVNPGPESDPIRDGYRSLPEAMALLLLHYAES